MKRFKSIVVFVNVSSGKDAALERAGKLASQNKADLAIVTVADEAGRHAPAALQNVVQQELAERLEQLAAPLRDRRIAVATRLLCGPPALAITQEVLGRGHDLVMKTAQGRGEDRGRLFGTVAQRLLRICPCPVWVVQPRDPQVHEVVLAAVDPSHNDNNAAGLNQKILELAVSLAESEARELHVVHAWDAATALASLAHVTPDQVESVEESFQQEAKRKLADCLAPWSSAIAPGRIHFFNGPADAAIRRLVAERDVDIIVMGTVARTGLARFFIGNTAERVLNQVTCSVLAVKPDGFVSPVERPA